MKGMNFTKIDSLSQSTPRTPRVCDLFVAFVNFVRTRFSPELSVSSVPSPGSLWFAQEAEQLPPKLKYTPMSTDF